MSILYHTYITVELVFLLPFRILPNTIECSLTTDYKRCSFLGALESETRVLPPHTSLTGQIRWFEIDYNVLGGECLNRTRDSGSGP